MSSPKYTFTQNWYQRQLPLHQNLLPQVLKMKGNSPISILEIGAFEGGTTTFIADNYLLHPDSIIVSIDPHSSMDTTSPVSDQTMTRFMSNIEKCKNPGKVCYINDTSYN